MSMLRFSQKQIGTALLSVLFILVLLTTLAAFTAADENLAIRRLSNQREYTQSLQVALGGEMWAVKELERDLSSTVVNYDYLNEPWAKLHETGIVSVEDGEMFVRVEDASGRFNLNNLIAGKKSTIAPNGQTATGTPGQIAPNVPPPSSSANSVNFQGAAGGSSSGPPGQIRNTVWYDLFVRLLESPDVGLPPELADAVVDWVDEDSKQTDPNGAEDDIYQSYEVPYRAANRQFSSVAELALVEGFPRGAIKALAPLVTALPLEKKGKSYSFTKINVNTAPIGVLKSLTDPPMDQLELENILLSRVSNPYDNPSGFITSLNAGGAARRDIAQLVDVKSDFYNVTACAKYGRIEVALSSLLKRDNSKKEVSVLGRQRRYECQREAE